MADTLEIVRVIDSKFSEAYRLGLENRFATHVLGSLGIMGQTETVFLETENPTAELYRFLLSGFGLDNPGFEYETGDAVLDVKCLLAQQIIAQNALSLSQMKSPEELQSSASFMYVATDGRVFDGEFGFLEQNEIADLTKTLVDYKPVAIPRELIER